MRDSFRHKINIYRKATVAVGGGSDSVTYNLLHSLKPCLLLDASGFEEFRHGKETVKIEKKILTRFLPTDPIKESDRVSWTDPITSEIFYFEIVRIKRLRNLTKEIKLFCIELDALQSIT
jgi:hypothetical protein